MVSTLMLSTNAVGQQTVITGHVLDSITQKPIPFAKVRFLNSEIGTRTDTAGFFQIVTRKATDSLEISFIGYRTQVFIIQKGVETELMVELVEASRTFDAIVITPGENPAFEILRQVRKNKKFNNPDKLEAWECENYNRIRLDANNFGDSIFTDRKLWKSMEWVQDYVDTTGEKNSIPGVLSQSLSTYYFRKTPKAEKEIIHAVDITGFSDIVLSEFSGSMYQDFNIYDNNIDLFTKDFISPISDFGRTFYRYYLQENDTIDDIICYHLKFVPRRKGDAVFDGDIWIADSSYAVKRVKCTLGEDVNINYVTDLRVDIYYEQVETGAWLPVKEVMRGDFDALNDVKKNPFIGGTVHKTTTRRNFVINQPKDFDFYVKDIVISDSAENRSEEYWATHRHEALDEKEQGVVEMVSALKKNRRFNFYEKSSYLLYTGFWKFGPIEVGNMGSLFNVNTVEGPRFMLSFRSSNKWSKNVEISTFGIYGTKDEEFKYGASLRWRISARPRTMFRVAYKKRIEQLGIRSSIGDVGSSFSTLFSLGPLDKLTMVRNGSMSIEKDWTFDMRSFHSLDWMNFVPLGNSEYHRIDSETGDTNQVTSLTSFQVRNQIMYTREEKFISGQFDRMSLGSRFPIISITHTWAIKDFLGSEYDFHRLDFVWSHRPKIGHLGKLDYSVYAGKVFGKVPYPFLNIHQGNQTFYLQRTTMNLLYYYEFISDEWVGVNLDYHLMGFFLNRIPLIRKLKLREVFNAKMVVGRYDEKNNEEMLLPNYSHEFNEPYYEVSAGLENIAKFIRLDFVWRLNYLDHIDARGKQVRPWGIFFTFASDF